MIFAVVAGLDTLALAAVALCVVGVIGSIIPCSVERPFPL